MEDTTDQEIAGDAWDKATKGITGGAAELAAFRERFIKGITSGGDLSELDQDLEDTLAELEWTWPWFEEWYTTFAGWGMFPHLWPPMQPEPDLDQPYTPEELAAYRKAAIAPLIAHTAAMIFFRDRHLDRSHSFQKWRLVHHNDPAEMRVATAKEDAIIAGDMTSLPPFFPGDRTSLQPQNPLADDDKRPEKN